MHSKSVEEIIEQAKKIEIKYNVRVSVIAEAPTSPMPWVSSGYGATIFIITPKDDQHNTLGKIRHDPEFSTAPIHEMWTAKELIALTKINPQIIRNNVGGTGFIPPFFFHQEVYGGFAKGFRKEFEAAFGPQLKKEIKERFQRLGLRTSRDINKRVAHLKAIHQSEKKLFGKAEQRQTFNWLRKTAERVAREEIETLIVLDRAARYLALPLKKVINEAHGKKIQVFFIDPGIYSDNISATEKNYRKLRVQLKTEHPYLVEAIRNGKIMIVDDLRCHGKTLKMTRQLLRGFKPQKMLSTVVFPRYQGKDVSWRKQNIYEVETNFSKLVAKMKKLTPKERQRINNLRKGMGVIADKVIKKSMKR